MAADMSNGFLLRRLLVTLQATATIGQVNAAGGAVGALGIASAEPGFLVVLFEVPQPDVAALQALAKKLRSQPGIAFAWPGQTAKTAVLPEFSPGVPVATEGLSHLLANRFPQAWNARAAAPADCLPRSVSVHVWDEFGDLNARPHFFLQVDASSFIGDPSGPGPGQDGHGYDVTTVLAGRFDGSTSTGVNGFKDCLLVHEEEAEGLDFLESIRRVVRHLAAEGRAGRPDHLAEFRPMGSAAAVGQAATPRRSAPRLPRPCAARSLRGPPLPASGRGSTTPPAWRQRC